MRVYKLYSASTSTTNAAANIQIARKGRIRAILWAKQATLTTTGAVHSGELSFGSTSQQATNDTIGPISQCSVSLQFTTSGAYMASQNVHQSGLDIPVNAGDRLYLNDVVAGTCSGHTSNVYLYVSE